MLHKPTNGNLIVYKPGKDFGSTATFSCVSGYRVIGSSPLTCKDGNATSPNGTWNGTTPTCKISKSYCVMKFWF